MEIKISKDRLFKIICDHFHCSDINDKQYPDCIIYEHKECSMEWLVDEIIEGGVELDESKIE